MIVVTGSKGFIGQNFLKALKDKEIKEVEKNDSWHFRQTSTGFNLYSPGNQFNANGTEILYYAHA